MISIDEMEQMLDEIAQRFPTELYKRLNGGIILLPEEKKHSSDQADDLFILGEYFRGGNLGRFIAIYYGSFMRVYGSLSKEALREKLESTLKHEFIHHLETMAGEKELEIEDARSIAAYMERHSQKDK
jgi:predicted Zn-dependent protease with MMP-like domain